ncbi:MAG TPA: cell division protein ZapD [Leucothrix mucor]|uniref:Cell division protein ZapD n=1 Tax=Leucothrix mucor TaxID=45248 RepID=A0A7V2WVL8_LEUMU|nr:cell division protein ZapD [Leucothrix mucor]
MLGKAVMAVYEQPLNEKIRLFLRLEFLVKRFKTHLADPSPDNCQAAVVVLLELYNLSSRLDVKNALLSMLDWQSQAVRRLSELEGVDADRLKKVLARLEEKAKQIYSFRGQLGQHLKRHAFLNLLRQRAGIAGNMNGFDVPLFNYWVHQAQQKRVDDLIQWVEPYSMAYDAIEIVLQLIRESRDSEEVVAEDGFFQAGLNTKRDYQLLRIELPEEVNYYPEISAGKQRFSIRFVRVEDLAERGTQELDNIPFSLFLCSL